MQFNNPKTESRELIPGLGYGFSEVDGWLPLVEQLLLANLSWVNGSGKQYTGQCFI